MKWVQHGKCYFAEVGKFTLEVDTRFGSVLISTDLLFSASLTNFEELQGIAKVKLKEVLESALKELVG